MVDLVAWLVHASLLLAAEPTPVAESPDPPHEAPRPTIVKLFARVDGLSFDDVAAALALRSPALVVERADRSDIERPDTDFAHLLVHLKAGTSTTWDVSLIRRNGDAYFRQVDARAEDAARVIATTIVSLLHGISAGTIAPDATHVPTPPVTGPVESPTPAPTPALPPVAPRPPSGPWLGVALHGGVVVGLAAPSDVHPLAAGGGGLGFEIRTERGAYASIDLRVAARVRDEHTLLRMRFAGAGGYAWRRGEFELVSAAFVAAEPWWLTHRAGRVDVHRRTSDESVSPWLVGGGLRIAPGWVRDVGARTQLRLGVRVELSGAAMPRGNVGRILVVDDRGALVPAFRLGGLELGGGLEFSVRVRATPGSAAAR